MMYIIKMCKIKEQIKREKKDVEPNPRIPIVKPGQDGTGILND